MHSCRAPERGYLRHPFASVWQDNLIRLSEETEESHGGGFRVFDLWARRQITPQSAKSDRLDRPDRATAGA